MTGNPHFGRALLASATAVIALASTAGATVWSPGARTVTGTASPAGAAVVTGARSTDRAAAKEERRYDHVDDLCGRIDTSSMAPMTSRAGTVTTAGKHTEPYSSTACRIELPDEGRAGELRVDVEYLPSARLAAAGYERALRTLTAPRTLPGQCDHATVGVGVEGGTSSVILLRDSRMVVRVELALPSAAQGRAGDAARAVATRVVDLSAV